MAQFFEQLNPRLIEFIRAQPVFFVATAPTQGRVNCSPKGMDTLRVLDDHTVAYLDLTGSGAETSAHIRADGRLTIMFCSFGESPLILRLYGHGEVIRPTDSRWADMIGLFPTFLGQRQIILLKIESLQTSCGFGVPRMELIQTRPTLDDWACKKGEAGLAEYRAKKNHTSIDGLPTGVGEPAKQP
jgi:hypothetical protein